MYNEILSTLLDVEKPLLQDRIDKINKSLQPGVDSLRWNSTGIDQFINICMGIVKEVDDLVKKMKDNVKNKPLFPEDLEQTHQSTIMPRLEDIKN